MKTTLKPIEIEDFFEQMRIPLRKHDQDEASRVAYFICDNKMPNGAVIPDASHDWTTLTVEEVAVGQWALLKLRQANCAFFLPLVEREVQVVLVQVIGLDVKTNSALVLHYYHEMSQVFTAWIPVTFLKFPELSLSPSSASFTLAGLTRRFDRNYLESTSHLAQQSLLKISIAIS